MKTSNKRDLIFPIIILLIAAFAVSFSAGCNSNNYSTNSTPPPATGGNTNTGQIVMQNSAFSPSSMTVMAGTTVTWTNKDAYNHTVTSGTPNSPDGKFDSGTIGPNGTFSYKFDTKGTYSYYCKVHPEVMTGTVIVQ